MTNRGMYLCNEDVGKAYAGDSDKKSRFVILRSALIADITRIDMCKRSTDFYTRGVYKVWPAVEKQEVALANERPFCKGKVDEGNEEAYG